MILIENYSIAVVCCVLAMICWGSWQNTRNWTGLSWRFELFYWDFSIGIVILSFLAAVTVGSNGDYARTFWQDLPQADLKNIGLAMLGGLLWNLGTLLLVAAISIAGMATAFPIGGGLAWLLGILVNFLGAPSGNPTLLFGGCTFIAIAIGFCTLAYRKLGGNSSNSSKGIWLALAAGIVISVFYRFVAISLISDYQNPELGKLTPFTAVFFFTIGALLSSFVMNTYLMRNPVQGNPVNFQQYLSASIKTHLIGVLGGMIWCMGMVFSFMASNAAGFAISYGLSNSAPIVAGIWGIFVWKEFANAPQGTNKFLVGMFLCYLLGLVMIICSR
jgi:glucose uptake protein